MASSDYRLCDVCGGKAFYDSCLSYEGPTAEEPSPRVAGQVDPGGLALGSLGDWAVICRSCAQTHRTCLIGPCVSVDPDAPSDIDAAITTAPVQASALGRVPCEECERLRKRTHEIAEAKDRKHALRARELGQLKAKIANAEAWANESLQAYRHEQGRVSDHPIDGMFAKHYPWWDLASEHNRLTILGLLERADIRGQALTDILATIAFFDAGHCDVGVALSRIGSLARLEYAGRPLAQPIAPAEPAPLREPEEDDT